MALVELDKRDVANGQAQTIEKFRWNENQEWSIKLGSCYSQISGDLDKM